jgi:hypothetical protein
MAAVSILIIFMPFMTAAMTVVRRRASPGSWSVTAGMTGILYFLIGAGMTAISLPSPFAAGVFMLGMLNGMNHLFQQFLKHTIASSVNWPDHLCSYQDTTSICNKKAGV